jgi:hypothetical protein
VTLTTSRRRNIAAGVVLALALAFLWVGARREHKAYDSDDEGFGILTFRRISDRQLVMDATFGGVERRDGRLFSTYDRSAPGGKRACPT